MKLKNKVALITGSSRGIGKAIALKFAQEGAKIIVNYRVSEDRAKEVVKEIEKIGSEAIAVKCDISDESEVKNLIKTSINKFGKIDILVNNAGIVYDVPLFEKTVEQWKETLNVNLIGAFLCSKYASEYMDKQESGVIINISSTNGINSLSPESADYDASKAGMISLTKNLAEELGPKIRVNSIAPGWIKTEMNNNLPKNFIEEEEEKTIMKRFANPEEIAKVTLFLATDESGFMTREIITVDGGYIN